MNLEQLVYVNRLFNFLCGHVATNQRDHLYDVLCSVVAGPLKGGRR